MNKIEKQLKELEDFATSVLITENAPQENITKLDGIKKGIQEVKDEYTKLYEENVSCKDVIFKMHLGTGSGETPKDETGDSNKPKSIEECMAEFAEKNKNKEII